MGCKVFAKSLNLNSSCLINFEPLKMEDFIKNICNSLTVYAKLFVKSLNLRAIADLMFATVSHSEDSYLKGDIRGGGAKIEACFKQNGC